MPIFQGTYWAQGFVIKENGTPVDITGWEFEADLKDNRDDTTSLLNLTTANGGFAVTSGAAGRFEMRVTADQSTDLPVARLVFDVLRTDVVPGPTYQFGGNVKVKRPVTGT